MSVDSVIQHHSSNGNHSLILPTKKKISFYIYDNPYIPVLGYLLGMDTWNLLSPKICAKIIIIKKMEFIFCRVFS